MFHSLEFKALKVLSDIEIKAFDIESPHAISKLKKNTILYLTRKTVDFVLGIINCMCFENLKAIKFMIFIIVKLKLMQEYIELH